MKVYKLLSIVVVTLMCFVACQNEIVFSTDGPSSGTLKADASGDCLPSTVNGIYRRDSVLTGDNFIDVNVNVTTLGTYTIQTDSLNGFYFTRTGTFGVLGNNVVRLYGIGKPVDGGVTPFTVSYDGSSCIINVTVQGSSTGAAIYTLGGAGAACAGFTLGAGTYAAGQILVAANTVTTNVNVTDVGTYDLGTDTLNGIYFRTTGMFTALGVQSITLSGYGTPIAPGTFNYTLTNGSTSCTFNITVTGGNTAVFTLGGSPGNCTGVTLNGNYQQSVAMTTANTAKIDVTVTTVGSYYISVPAVNNVSFSAAGNFTSTGTQQITLYASGIPASAGPFNYAVSESGGSNCGFAIIYTPPPPPAVYTLSGAPGNCTPINVSGTYTAGTVLTAANYAEVEVNVTTIGTYTLSTGVAVNGMIFSASGNFTSTGMQTVRLIGNGTPTTATTSTFAPQTGTSSCTFDIITDAAPAAPAVLTCKIDGTFSDFSSTAVALLISNPPGEMLSINGFSTSGSGSLSISFVNSTGSVTPGTYTQANSPSKIITLTYEDPTAAIFLGVTPANNITFKLTSLTSTRAIGTFSGTVSKTGGGMGVKNITEGVFDVPRF